MIGSPFSATGGQCAHGISAEPGDVNSGVKQVMPLPQPSDRPSTDLVLTGTASLHTLLTRCLEHGCIPEARRWHHEVRGVLHSAYGAVAFDRY